MSMLARYKKPGGVAQLVTLLETCLSKKREMLLTTISNEDKEFGAMVQAKLLTPQKIFSWDPLLVCEATTRMTDRALAICLKNLPAEYFGIATHTMKELKKKAVRDLYEALTPTPVEMESAQIKLIEVVRDLVKTGTFKMDENDAPILPAHMKKAG